MVSWRSGLCGSGVTSAPPPANGRVDGLRSHRNAPEAGTVIAESTLSLSVCGSCQPFGQCRVSLTCWPMTGRPGSTSGSAPIVQYVLVLVSKSLCRCSTAPAGALPVTTEWEGASAAASPASSSASRRPPLPESAGLSPWVHWSTTADWYGPWNG